MSVMTAAHLDVACVPDPLITNNFLRNAKSHSAKISCSEFVCMDRCWFKVKSSPHELSYHLTFEAVPPGQAKCIQAQATCHDSDASLVHVQIAQPLPKLI